MAPTKRNRSKKLLANSRPGANHSSRAVKVMSSKATRTMIRSHHVLQKQLKQAQSVNDETKAASIERQIESFGGLNAYQKASIQGQADDRGGDSSKVLVQWLHELDPEKPGDLRLLEVGSLKVDNACARSGMFDVVRIDLNSQHPAILQQDFMERPVPTARDLSRDGFDVISLSLVVNYVPDASSRGEMLRRTCAFLRHGRHQSGRCIPALFVVLPAPCVTNSRYLDEATFKAMMQNLGYTMLKSKVTSKLVYYYFILNESQERQTMSKFPKRELRQGKHMNNFAIVFK